MSLPKKLFALLVLALPFTASKAQQNAPGLQESTRTAESTHAAQEMTTEARTAIHVTGDERVFPGGAEALQQYHALKEFGEPVLRKSALTYELGDERDFNVVTDIGQGTSVWETLPFVLRASSAAANVWVASDLTDAFTETDMQQLEDYILAETPQGSFDTSRGIIENNNDTFGSPPDFVDPDGQVDILMFDIEEAEGCCVLGYVTRADLIPPSQPGQGNGSNVLYVDLPDGMQDGGVFGIAGTIAHEYQHLIHYEYAPTDEVSFVNEGLSEWAEIINGFLTRAITYLTIPEEHGVALFEWRTDEATSIVVRDYQRAGLFTTYLADRLGREATGSIVRAKCQQGDPCAPGSYVMGELGYEIVLRDHGLTLAEVLSDFNTANFINDRSLGSSFGYALPQRQNVRAVTTESTDAQLAPSPSTHEIDLDLGAFRYVSWTNVSDLHLSFADDPAADPSNRDQAALRLVKDAGNGVIDVVDVDPYAEEAIVAGEFERVTLIATHIRPTDPSFAHSIPPLQLDITATWEGGSDVTAEGVAYDDGQNEMGFYFFPEQNAQANGFDVPENARISSVSVAPVYENQFANGPGDGLPRDFRLTIWADDGSGLPGDVLHTEVVEESVTETHFFFTTSAYSPREISLSQTLDDLPERIYVGISNTGGDENLLVLAPAGNPENAAASFVYDAGAGTWLPIGTYSDELVGQTFPIRAKFLIPTSVEPRSEMPARVELHPNFPNPFNPATVISYVLPRPMQVRLAVYNVLGQRVATLAEGLQNAGLHELRLDAADWASGVYVYALETETQTLTQHMVVLK